MGILCSLFTPLVEDLVTFHWYSEIRDFSLVQWKSWENVLQTGIIFIKIQDRFDFQFFLHLTPYLWISAHMVGTTLIFGKFGKIWLIFIQIGLNWTYLKPFFRFDMLFAELTSLGANYSTLTLCFVFVPCVILLDIC